MIGKLLPSNTCITSLEFISQDIGDTGVDAICRGSKTNTTESQETRLLKFPHRQENSYERRGKKYINLLFQMNCVLLCLFRNIFNPYHLSFLDGA